jgi:glucokinase
MESNRLYLGIDYGGTAVKMGIVSEEGLIMGAGSVPAPSLPDEAACRAFAAQVGDFVASTGAYRSEIGGIALAVPGVVGEDGSVFSPNVTVDWPELRRQLGRLFSQDVVATLNDANAAALGELWHGGSGNAASALLVTIGTGVGAGIIADGHVLQGRNGAAGEFGHMTVVRGGRPCRCGRKGCVEQYASARGIVRSFREADERGVGNPVTYTAIEPKHDTDTVSVFKACRAGDARAQYALDVFNDRLGFALAQVACVVDPDVILLGGGVAQGADLFLDDLRASYREKCLSSCADTEIRTAQLSNQAGVYGAARYAMFATQGLADEFDAFGINLH